MLSQHLGLGLPFLEPSIWYLLECITPYIFITFPSLFPSCCNPCPAKGSKTAWFPSSWGQWHPLIKTNCQHSAGSSQAPEPSTWIESVHPLIFQELLIQCPQTQSTVHALCTPSPKHSNMEQYQELSAEMNSKRLASFIPSCCEIHGFQTVWPAWVPNVTVVTFIHIRETCRGSQRSTNSASAESSSSLDKTIWDAKWDSQLVTKNLVRDWYFYTKISILKSCYAVKSDCIMVLWDSIFICCQWFLSKLAQVTSQKMDFSNCQPCTLHEISEKSSFLPYRCNKDPAIKMLLTIWLMHKQKEMPVCSPIATEMLQS